MEEFLNGKGLQYVDNGIYPVDIFSVCSTTPFFQKSGAQST